MIDDGLVGLEQAAEPAGSEVSLQRCAIVWRTISYWIELYVSQRPVCQSPIVEHSGGSRGGASRAAAPPALLAPGEKKDFNYKTVTVVQSAIITS